MQIPVLFVNEKTVYSQLDCDCWDEKRNAVKISSRLAGVYHPPCRTWGRLRSFANFHPGEHWLAVWAIIRIRKYGGVLEHPAGSTLWKLMCLPLPGSGYDSFGGFSVKINQHDFGFECEKNTWLYICGIDVNLLPVQPLNFNAITHTISSSKIKSGKKEISKNKRASTTIILAAYLVQIAEIINYKKLSNLLNS